MLGRSPSESAHVNVIVLGDMMPTSMHHILRLLEVSSKFLPSGYRFTFKPHPGYPVKLTDYPGLKAEETRKALGEILGAYDVAIAANSTSAAVDAYLAGLPVIIGLDGNDLNLSPLRGRRGVRFISTCDELVDALQTTGSSAEITNSDRTDFFFLDRNLPRWKSLLRLDS
jgi:surface carbohydrate biosynthesis protein (TIGR04326 family)